MKLNNLKLTELKKKKKRNFSLILFNVIKIAVVIILLNELQGCILLNRSEKNPTDIPKQIISTNVSGTGTAIELEFTKGKSFNHPSMVLWMEDTNGKFIQTLFITKSVATGIFEHGKVENDKWVTGEISRPASLPYWANKRGIIGEDNLFIPGNQTQVPDAYTGATPSSDFILNTKTDKKIEEKVCILFEINQPWDWNEFWTNTMYLDDKDYRTSCQPSLIYKTEINLQSQQNEYIMKVVGHGHYSGKTGELFTDLSTITTALEIIKELKIHIKR